MECDTPRTHCMGSVPGSLQTLTSSVSGDQLTTESVSSWNAWKVTFYVFTVISLSCGPQSRFRRVKRLYCKKKKKKSSCFHIYNTYCQKLGHIWAWEGTEKQYLKLKPRAFGSSVQSKICALRQLTRIFAGLCLWGSSAGTSLFLTRWGMVEFLKKALSSGVSSGGAAGCKERARNRTSGTWALGTFSLALSARQFFFSWLWFTWEFRPVLIDQQHTHQQDEPHWRPTSLSILQS